MTMRSGTRVALFVALAATLGTSLVVACVGDEPVGTGQDAAAPTTPDAAATTTADSAPPPAPDSSTPPADATTADAADAGPKTFCATQLAPVGFVDFFCADFDGQGAVDEGFTSKKLSDGGVLSRTTTVAFSQPAALLTNGMGTNRVGSVSWLKAGPTPFVQAVLTARINPDITAGVVPPGTGSVKLLEIRTGNALASVNYTAGANVGGNAYTGYYFEGRAFGGGVALTQEVITTRLTSSVWTDVKLTWSSNGAVTVAYNDVNVFSDMGFSSTDTSVTFTVGSEGSGTTGAVAAHRYDNVTFAIRRP